MIGGVDHHRLRIRGDVVEVAVHLIGQLLGYPFLGQKFGDSAGEDGLKIADHADSFLPGQPLVGMGRDLGLRDFREAGIQGQIGKANPDVGMAAEVALEIVEVLPVFDEGGSRGIGMDAVVKDLGVVKHAAGLENPFKLPHRQWRIGQMLHHPAEEGTVEAVGVEWQFIGRSLKQRDLTRGQFVGQQDPGLGDLLG